MNSPDCGFQIIPGGLPLATPTWHGTDDERKELVRIVLHEWGKACECHPAIDTAGKIYAVHLCPPHQFIHERDEAGRISPVCFQRRFDAGAVRHDTCVSRVDRLLFARRLRATWLAQEGILQHCRRCDSIYQVSHTCVGEAGPVECSLGSGDLGGLPW
jgi:hypothetical protein